MRCVCHKTVLSLQSFRSSLRSTDLAHGHDVVGDNPIEFRCLYILSFVTRYSLAYCIYSLVCCPQLWNSCDLLVLDYTLPLGVELAITRLFVYSSPWTVTPRSMISFVHFGARGTLQCAASASHAGHATLRHSFGPPSNPRYVRGPAGGGNGWLQSQHYISSSTRGGPSLKTTCA